MFSEDIISTNLCGHQQKMNICSSRKMIELNMIEQNMTSTHLEFIKDNKINWNMVLFLNIQTVNTKYEQTNQS